MSNDLDALLRAELEKLRRKDPEAAAKLLGQALGRPAGRTKAVGPAYPIRTQHHSPMESESVFVRYAGWWDELECQTCQHTERRFDGLFEERAWKNPAEHPASGPRHWLKAVAKPLPELLSGAVTYVRYHHVAFCHECCGAANWPLAESYHDGVSERESVVLAPTVQEQTNAGVSTAGESSASETRTAVESSE